MTWNSVLEWVKGISYLHWKQIVAGLWLLAIIVLLEIFVPDVNLFRSILAIIAIIGFLGVTVWAGVILCAAIAKRCGW